MKTPSRLTLLTTTIILPLTLAECECGFSVNRTDSEHFGLFTNMLETDFLHAVNVSSISVGTTGWRPQVYDTSAEDSSGPYGTSKQLGNVIANPLPAGQWSGAPASVGDAGLQLWVRHEVERGLVPVAEVAGPHPDMLYGSFRAAIKFTAMNGTCGAFFWYRNDSCEIDIEFLSNDTSAVELVVHTDQPGEESFGPGSDKSAGSNRFGSIMDLPDGFHEMRFDWLPDRVDYYIDGMLTMTARDKVPHTRGHLMLSHWSNGNEGWSGGPPLQDAVMTVGYVKAYFNTTSRDEPKAGCRSLEEPGSVCEIPTQHTPPIADGDWTHFFTIPRPKDSEREHASESGEFAYGQGSASRPSVGVRFVLVVTCLLSRAFKDILDL